MEIPSHAQNKQLLLLWSNQNKISKRQYSLASDLIDLLTIRNIECMPEERCDGTIFIGLAYAPLLWETDGTDYYVTEILEPGVSSEVNIFDGTDIHNVLMHITTKYSYLKIKPYL